MKKILVLFIFIITLSSVTNAQSDAGNYKNNPLAWPGWVNVGIFPSPTAIPKDQWDPYGFEKSLNQYGTAVLFETVNANYYVPYNFERQYSFTAYIKNGPFTVSPLITVSFWNSPRLLTPGVINVRVDVENGKPKYYIE